MKNTLENLLKEDIQTYYWIGFLLADGHFTSNNRLILHLSIRDISVMYNFLSYLQRPCNIQTYNRFVRLAVMDTDTVKSLKNKFNISNRKTYEPPTINIVDNNLYLSLLIGFIDGDGTIHKQSGRKDTIIRLHIHSAWIHILADISIRLQNIFNTYCSQAKIGKDGYANLNISNSIIVTGLKKFIISNKLVVLDRKWSIIDESYISHYTIAKNIRNVVYPKLDLGLDYKTIAKDCNISLAYVYKIAKEERRAI